MSNTKNISAGMDAIELQSQSLTTPTGLQSTQRLTRRRRLVVFLNVATNLVLLSFAAKLMAAGGWTLVDAVMFVCFAMGVPWAVLGFWNSLIGLWLRHGGRDPLGQVAPYYDAAFQSTPLTQKTAILMTLRNEDPERALTRLKTVKRSVDETGHGGSFDYFILSDTSNADVAMREEALVEAWRAVAGLTSRIVYRRREENTGFKAGNVRDFCSRWGRSYEFMLPLDADSLMSGEAIVAMARVCQSHPRIGILQSLVVGLPSKSAFARIFQFGMRHGMRTYTMGQAFWAADCGPFWGHNALVRIKPFYDLCVLPEVPGKGPFAGHILSHDQVEATLMRRAGFEVLVLPVEGGSWEENPPTILDYTKRDQRWCQGNLQYTKILGLRGLEPMSRFQLVWAILMFASLPAGVVLIALTPLAAFQAQSIVNYPTGLAIALYCSFVVMSLMPKLAGLADVCLTPGAVKRYGGAGRFALSSLIEVVFALLQGAITTTRTTIFIASLLIFGRSVRWNGQDRELHRLSWMKAVREFWPQTVFGALILAALFAVSPTVLAWSLPLTAGYVLAIPFAVVTATPMVGRFMVRTGLCGVPEDFAPVPETMAIQQHTAAANDDEMEREPLPQQDVGRDQAATPCETTIAA
ncbi:MAG: glucans biosynthesis glucosyltransferase MdoH [Hyphomicrobiaceae bacterium]